MPADSGCFWWLFWGEKKTSESIHSWRNSQDDRSWIVDVVEGHISRHLGTMETSWNLQIVVFNGSLQPYYDVLLHGLGNSLLNGFIACLKYAISSSTSLGPWSLPRVDPTISCATWLTVIVAPLIILNFLRFQQHGHERMCFNNQLFFR